MKKTTKDIVIKINKEVADALGIDKKSALEMIVTDGMLIIRSKNKKLLKKERLKQKI